jgi:Icc-related predicted phosphoesterase
MMVSGDKASHGRAAVGTLVAAEPKKLKAQRQQLTILVGADLHGSRQGLDWFAAQATALQPKLVAFLGDFITNGPISFISEVMRELRMLAPSAFVIPGNWDPRDALSRLDTEAFDGLQHMHKHTTMLGGYMFAGLGGSQPTPVGTTPMEMPDKLLAAPLPALLPADVWLLHNPVYGFQDQLSSGEKVGSKKLLAVYSQQVEPPTLVMSGHIHEAYGVANHNHTTFVNPGSLQEMRAAWVVLDDAKVEVELLKG